MDNFVCLVVFILSTLSVEYAIQMKSIKLSENVIYDCMDIYEQPSLSHPLLKHHIIQLKPSRYDSRSKNKFAEKRHKRRINCPVGTVPILRTKKENVIYSQQNLNNHFTFLTAHYPGTHIAGLRTSGYKQLRGVRAGMTGHLLKIGKDQSSSAQTYVATQTNNDSNSIQVGWMINERLFGDTQIWSYGIWLGKNGKGCFNVKCRGFVQVAKDYPLSEPWNYMEGDILLISIHQDKKSKNWWVSQILPDKSRIDIGYWPKELFNLLGDGADMVGFGGIVKSDPKGSSPPMGNGHLPNEHTHAYVIRMNVIDPNYKIIGANLTTLDTLLDNKNCYGVRYIGYVDEEVGVAMSYGGPGGDSCGV